MKVVGVVSDGWVSRFSKPMKISEVKGFKRRYSEIWNVIYFERRYNLIEIIINKLKTISKPKGN